MHSHLQHITIRVLAILLVSLFACSCALASTTATVNCDSLNVRESASTSAKKLGALPLGTEVEILATTGSWSKISYKGYTGYAASEYLTAVAATGKRVKAYAAKNAPAYKSASTSSKKLGTVKKGTVVYVVGKSGGFYKVQNASGSITGYMAASSLRKANSSGASSAGSGGTKAERVISAARSMMGKPYILATSGPNAFDCSGLTSYCYGRVGVSLYRSAAAQGYNNGRKIKKSELKAGDLVFFNTDPDDNDLCDHVGIYIGGGKFIHASSAAGKVVTSYLSSGYYARVFSWGRRVL